MSYFSLPTSVNECEADYSYFPHIAEIGNVLSSLCLSIICMYCYFRGSYHFTRRQLLPLGAMAGVFSGIFHAFPSKFTLGLDHLGIILFASLYLQLENRYFFPFLLVTPFWSPSMASCIYLILLFRIFLTCSLSHLDRLIGVLGISCLVLEGGFEYCPMTGWFTLHFIWHLISAWLIIRLLK